MWLFFALGIIAVLGGIVFMLWKMSRDNVTTEKDDTAEISDVERMSIFCLFGLARGHFFQL